MSENGYSFDATNREETHLFRLSGGFARREKLPVYFVGRVTQDRPKAIKVFGRGTLETKAMGTCSVCGRTLTHPVSLTLGVGPECGNHWWNWDTIGGYTPEVIEALKIKIHDVKVDTWVPRACVIEVHETEDKVDLPKQGTIEMAGDNGQMGSPKEGPEQERIAKLEGTDIHVFFPYSKEDVENVRTLDGRHFVSWMNPKRWTCPASVDNVIRLDEWGFALDAQLQIMLSLAEKIADEDVEENDKFLKHLSIAGKLYPFQKEGVEFLERRRGRALLGDEMGCIEGDAVINVNRAGAGRPRTLAECYRRSQPGHRYSWDLSIPTFVRVLKSDGTFGLHEVDKFLRKGRKPVVKLVLASGKKLRLTADHEVRTKEGWPEVGKLRIGDIVLTNGQAACKTCGGTEKVVTSKYAQFQGHCRPCIYKEHRTNRNDVYSRRHKGGDGYIYLRGWKYHDHPRYSSSGVLEHVYLMEKWLGRSLLPNEEVHHKNEVRDDNSRKNLEVKTRSEHKTHHRAGLRFHGAHTKAGNEIVLVPKEDRVTSIKEDGEAWVYDVVMKDPHRNFVANGIVVHNCGKTVQALAYVASHPRIRPAVVACPATIKLNWRREIRKWIPGVSVRILEGRKPYLFDDDNVDFIIINYDVLGPWVDTILEYNPQVLILDECHMLRNHKANRTTACKRLAAKIPHIIGLTGTPVVNRPMEFYNALQMIDKTAFPMDRFSFGKLYCAGRFTRFGWDFRGSSNLDKLHKRLTETLFLRRLKKDVLQDLPEKQYSVVPMEMTSTYEYDKALADFRVWREDIDERRKNGEKVNSGAEVLVQIEKLKQICLKGKLPQAIDWIKDFIEGNGKLVVFTTHREGLEALKKEFGDKAVKLDGSSNQTERQEAVDRFQEDESIRLFIGNIKAAGVGITLTAASSVAFLELPWTPGDLDQATDRVHRIGQKDAVNAYYLVAENTIEDSIVELLDSKRKVISKAVDGRDADEESLFAALLAQI